LDLRNDRIFSIDPPTARDLDDACSIKALADGNYELGVHIADVSYFVREGTKLDEEALERATSVYLVQKVIPMLPRLLCEELCSLNPNVERFAFSVHWTIDAEANIIGEPRFAKSIIRSCAKLSYDHAQAVIDGESWDKLPAFEIGNGVSASQLEDDIKLLFKFSKLMRKRRFDNGSLTLNSIKLWFKLDEVGNPIDSGTYLLKDANRLIEEVHCLSNYSTCYWQTLLLVTNLLLASRKKLYFVAILPLKTRG
jgi:protein SSD1